MESRWRIRGWDIKTSDSENAVGEGMYGRSGRATRYYTDDIGPQSPGEGKQRAGRHGRCRGHGVLRHPSTLLKRIRFRRTRARVAVRVHWGAMRPEWRRQSRDCLFSASCAGLPSMLDRRLRREELEPRRPLKSSGLLVAGGTVQQQSFETSSPLCVDLNNALLAAGPGDYLSITWDEQLHQVIKDGVGVNSGRHGGAGQAFHEPAKSAPATTRSTTRHSVGQFVSSVRSVRAP
jgi:hypothetical protein